MPELPEVEIVKQSLQKAVKLKKIHNVLVNNRNLRFKLNKKFEKNIINKRIINIKRHAKFLILEFEKSDFLIIHFGMSGTLHILKKHKNIKKTNLSFYHSQNLPKKHNHILFYFKNFKIIYNDPRRFGFLKYFSDLKKLKNYLKKYGLEPFDKSFNTKYLINKISKTEKNIKNILIDQNIISGIGNIYASEILFYAKINPNKKGNQLSYNCYKKLTKFSKYVLNKAIIKGGSSIQNFRNIENNKGLYQNEFKVYDRENKICKRTDCKYKIKKTRISNRSTFYCENCQK
tara:strand:- start:225 stop:1088 length:864 start_codon:yes stop_codon:yes gene_type:complete